jgi:hypothetical protein
MGGGASQETQEQQQVQLQSSQQQLQFNTQMMALFQKQFASQQNVLNYLQSITKPIVAQSLKGQGMSTPALNAMRTSATDTLSSQFQSAQQALNATEAGQMGGTNVLPSGTRAQLNAALLASEAQSKAGAQNQITQYNQDLANSNLWKSLNVISGVGNTTDPLGYAGAFNQGGATIAQGSGAQSQLQNAITQANNSSFFGTLGRSFAGSLGQSLGTMTAGSFSGMGAF